MSVVFINAGKCETPLIMKVFEFPKWGCSYSILSTFERSTWRIHLNYFFTDLYIFDKSLISFTFKNNSDKIFNEHF